MGLSKEEERPDYKLTKVGWIPEDWGFPVLKEITKINQGLQIPISKRLTKKLKSSIENWRH